MLRVEYKSKVSISQDDLGLLDIIRECDRHDSDQIVTGFLRYDGTRFHHVLEGSDDVLGPLFEALRRDSRHHKISIEDYSFVDEREHSGFSFHYVASINPTSPTTVAPPIFALVEGNPAQILQT